MGKEIAEHFEDLMEFAAKCDVVAEIGVCLADDTSSTVALLKGTRKELHSVDLIPRDYTRIREMARQLGKRWVFYSDDSRLVVLPQVEFLFIDSDHKPSQVIGELNLHSRKVTKYIGFHDTHPCEHGKFPTYAKAIRDWMATHKDWVSDPILDKTNCCGLTIYRRK